MLWRSTVTLKISHPDKDPNEFAVNYGVTDALSAFPLHSLVSTMTCTINNNTVSQNLADTLPILLRLVDPEEFARYDCMTPTALDYLGDYRDGIHKMEYQLDVDGTGGGNTDPRPTIYRPGTTETKPTGSNAGNDLGFTATRPVSFLSHNNNVLGYDVNRVAGTAYYHKGRGSWKLKQMYAIEAGNKRKPLVADTEVYVVFEVTEPLLMSPFVFGSGYGKQGFYGIQTMNFQMNILPTANRAWRSAAWYNNANPNKKFASTVSFDDSQLLFQISHTTCLRHVGSTQRCALLRTTSVQKHQLAFTHSKTHKRTRPCNWAIRGGSRSYDQFVKHSAQWYSR